MRGSGAHLSQLTAASPARLPKSESRINIVSYTALSDKTLREINDERTDTMKSILEEFARGNIAPGPRFFKQDSRYARAIKKLTECEDELLAALSEDEKGTLKEFTDTQADIDTLTGVDSFIHGFRLGVLMTVEVFEGKDDLIVGGGIPNE